MNSKDNKEIDINNVFQAIYLFLKKHFKYILIITIIGLISGYSKSKLSKRFYKTDMVTTVGIIDKGFLYTSIEYIKELISDKNYQLLSTYLDLPLKKAKCLKSVELDTLMRNQLQFEIMFFNQNFGKDLATGVLSYLNNNKYYKKSLAELTQNYEQQLEKIDQELSDSDSIQKAIIENFDKNSQIVLLNSTLNSDVIQLLERKIKFKEKLNNVKPIEIILAPYKPLHPQNNAIRSSLILGVLSFLFSIILFFIIEIARSISKQN